MPNLAKRLTLVLAVGGLSLTSVGVASAEPVFVAATENLFISAGCPGTGTCTSTRWLGKTAGDATSNFTTAITPVDEVIYRADGSINWRDYAGDDSLRALGYPLRAAEPIKVNVEFSAEGPGVNNTVHARVEAVMGNNQTVTFGPLEQTVTTMAPASANDVSFSFDIPDALDRQVAKSLTFYVAIHGVNAAAGYINQEGGSTLELPYWREEV
jgi:hypothetical protein